MSEQLGQQQELRQEQRLGQLVTQQQLLHSQLVELPITGLLERINTEINDNPALETVADDYDHNDYQDYQDNAAPFDDIDDYDSQREQEERMTALDEALENIGRDDDELPVYHGGNNIGDDREEMVYGQTISFYDQLEEQLSFANLTERQHDIMAYLIGSLDDDGLLRKSLAQIADELAIYQNIDATEQELTDVLLQLQQFDPAGIGARSLQECLLLQISRRTPSCLTTLMQQVISEYFDEFKRKHWGQIQQALHLSDIQAHALFQELRKLNPKPGASLGETVGRSIEQITPDFIVETLDDGTVTFTLNNSEMPELKVSQSFADSMKEYDNDPAPSRQTKEALVYIKKKVASAQIFIEAIKMRQRTLTLTMQAIIRLQHQFFIDGDESSLKPMVLRDVADKTGLDISTISRVSNSKYALTRWGIFPLRHFFSDSIVTDSGEELSTRKIKAALRDIINAEDKKKPLSDETLTTMLADKGFPIARRTVAKYREQMGIPTSRMRKG